MSEPEIFALPEILKFRKQYDMPHNSNPVVALMADKCGKNGNFILELASICLWLAVSDRRILFVQE
ncbi:hypothetical protein [Arcanobacterium hippocoleae]|uniref:Uncharacterized protein n=1 Tax=Arcanobacterium hippocoleae TaxID=149017 RepID=A0ABU1T179_9ACTO|nr:hypothetical protein [Arcanobacterium hippocoleae]MDR6939129.1 hypothetical protein [Arcanobacterium hippocoleae]